MTFFVKIVVSGCGADERGDPPARAVVGRVGLLRQRVDAAVDVRVVLAQVVGDARRSRPRGFCEVAPESR